MSVAQVVSHLEQAARTCAVCTGQVVKRKDRLRQKSGAPLVFAPRLGLRMFAHVIRVVLHVN